MKQWRSLGAMAIAIALVVAIAGCGSSEGESGSRYFVSPGGSDGNPGTRTEPFQSLGKAYRSATPGSTVEVEAGTYSDQQTLEYDPNKASASQPVTFVAEGHAHFVAAKPTASHWTNIAAGHVSFRGDFEFDFVVIRNDEDAMSEIAFRETWIHHLGENGNLNGLYLYRNKMGPNNLWPGTGGALKPTTGPDDILNLGIGKVCANRAACFAYSAKNVKIVGDTFSGAYHSWSGSHSDCLQYTVGQSGYIAGNTFKNCQDETLILQGSLGPLAHITIENNELGRPIEGSDPFAVHISPCSECVIRFNSVPAHGSLFYAASSPDQGSPAPAEEIYGNLGGYYDPEQCSASEAEGWSWEYNVFSGGGGICGAHSVESATPASTAVDFYRGSAPVPATDIDGARRPQGAYADAGAFESGPR